MNVAETAGNKRSIINREAFDKAKRVQFVDEGFIEWVNT